MNFWQNRNKIISTIPQWYNPFIHAILPSTLGISIISLCLYFMSNVTWTSFLCIPFTIIALFLFEWCTHKYILHTKQPLLGFIYQSHGYHHIIYTNEQMAMLEKKELYFIMLPPYAILLVFCLVTPLAFGIGMIFGGLNVACLIMITSMLFFLFYEWLHLAYHQPANSFFGKNRLIGKLRRLHRRHHDPKLMKNWNFNVTIPVFDWILGTYRKE